MNNEVTNKEALKVIQAFARQSEKNVAFGVLADIKNGGISTFIKGEESDILALLAMQMAKESDFKKLLFKAIETYKLVSIEKIINENLKTN